MDGVVPTSPESLKHLFRELDFRPRKSLGQSFLTRESIARRLVASLGSLERSTVLEIGGGFGILTALLAQQTTRLIVYELDPVLFDFLKRTFPHLTTSLGTALSVVEGHPSIRWVRGDICKSPFSEWVSPPDKLKVIGNLPYASSSAILLHLMGQRGSIGEAVLTLQREVAERCLATPGSKSYSPLTCAIQYGAEVEKLFLIPPNAFYPRPEVTSCAIRLTFSSAPRVSVSNEEFFFKVIRTAFGKRRKQLINSLGGLGVSKPALLSALKASGIAPSRRAEELSLEAFAMLTGDVSYAMLSRKGK